MNNSILRQNYAVKTSVAYSHYNKQLALDEADRHVFKKGMYENGDTYSIVQLNKEDAHAIWFLSKLIDQKHPNSLKRRSIEEYERLAGYEPRFNGKGGMMFGVVNSENCLVGMAGLEVMDDESDAGSGPVVHFDGEKNNYTQLYWKTLGVLSDQLPEDQKHVRELYEIRNNLTVLIGRPYAVMKTNTPGLADRYAQNGWINMSRDYKGLKELSLVYETEEARQGKQVEVLILPLRNAKKWMKQNGTGMTMPELCIVKHDEHEITVSKSTTLTPILH